MSPKVISSSASGLNVRLGMSPISWSNDDLPQLGGETSLETCLIETRQAGIQAPRQVENSPIMRMN